MTSAKRTPRYVDAIRPFEVVERGMSADVIRLRPEIGPALPPITAHWPRAKAVPVSRRPWQLLLVPPTPGAPTRTFNVARWHARLVLGAMIALLVVAVAGVSTLVVAVRAPEVFTSEETETLRARLLVVEDSLALAMSELAEPTDSAVAAAAAASPATAAPAAAVTRRASRLLTPGLKPGASRSYRASDEGSGVGGIADLPVIGAIASRFSRARRHPLLHVIRPHLGVDVAAPRGTRITAPAPGRVSFVGRKFGFGLVVEIDHGKGVVTRYAHCGTALVSVGARVLRGLPIATVGTSGLSTGPHLHYEVIVNGRQVDPLRYRIPQPAADSVTTVAPLSLTPAAAAAPMLASPSAVAPHAAPAPAAQ